MRRLYAGTFGLGVTPLIGALATGEELRSGWIVVLSGLLLAGAILWTLTTEGAVNRFPTLARLPGAPEPRARALRRGAAELSDEIYGFLAERKRDDPVRGPPLRDLPPGATKEETSKAFWNEADKSTAHYTETMNRYAQRFSADALALCDEAIALGWLDESERSEFEHPTNPLGIEHVARTLGSIGKRRM